jgi:phosphoribosylglycinamide formyltransferase 1
MVHLVPDEGVDDGPVLATRAVPIDPSESLADLEARVHGVEHDLLVDTLSVLVDPARHAPAAPPTVPTPA